MDSKKKMLAIVLFAVYGVLFVCGSKKEATLVSAISKIDNQYSSVLSSQNGDTDAKNKMKETIMEYGGTLGENDRKYAGECLDSARIKCSSQKEFTDILSRELKKQSASIEIFYDGVENLKPFLGIDADEYGIDSASCSYIHMKDMTGVIFSIVYEGTEL